MGRDENTNGRKINVGTALTVLGIIGAPLAVWGDAQLERGATKEKIANIERRQEDDRQNFNREQQEIKRDVKQIGTDVQVILRKLDALEAGQKQRGQR